VKPIRVHMSWQAIRMYAGLGVERQIHAMHRDLKDLTNADQVPSYDPWGNNINGAIGEAAVAKALGIWFEPTINTFDRVPDVGPYQVRCMKDFIIRPRDKPEQIYIWVTNHCPFYDVMGWIYGHEARRPEWEGGFPPRPKAWFVPNDPEFIHDMATLPPMAPSGVERTSAA
jgi:hypothetical protein